MSQSQGSFSDLATTAAAAAAAFVPSASASASLSSSAISSGSAAALRFTPVPDAAVAHASSSSQFRTLPLPALADAAAAASSLTLESNAEVYRSVGAEVSAPLPMATFSGAWGQSGDTMYDSSSGSTSSEWGVDLKSKDLSMPSLHASSAAADFGFGKFGTAPLPLPVIVPGPASAPSSDVEVEECPLYYERYSSFLSTAEPVRIWHALLGVLHSHGIEVAVDADRHKVKAVVVTNNVSASVVIRLWRRSTEGAYMVEFQRRSGDVVTFYNFYRAIRESLSALITDEHPTVTLSQPTSSQSQSQSQQIPLSVMPLPSVPLDLSIGEPGLGAVTLDDATFATLNNMCQSDDTDALKVLVSAATATARADQNQAFLLAAPPTSGRTSPVQQQASSSSAASASTTPASAAAAASTSTAAATQRRRSQSGARVLPVLTHCLKSSSAELQCFAAKLLHVLASSSATSAATRRELCAAVADALVAIVAPPAPQPAGPMSSFVPVSNKLPSGHELLLRETKRVAAASLALLAGTDSTVLAKHAKQLDQLKLATDSRLRFAAQSLGL